MKNQLEVIYDETQLLIFTLEDKGYTQEALEIANSFYGSTFGEILSNIGCVIESFINNDIKYEDEIILKFKKIIYLINKFTPWLLNQVSNYYNYILI